MSQAIGQVSNNIGAASGTGYDLDDFAGRTSIVANNGVASANTVNQNIVALNETIGDMKTDLHSTYTAGAVTGNAITNGGQSPVYTVVDALNNIDATLGTIHGLKAKMAAQGKDYGNLADGTTVEEHIVSVDAAIGDRSQFGSSNYMTQSAPVADAMMALDNNLARVENRVHKLDRSMKSGFAAAAAMAGLVPNARAAGDTQVSLGAGTYHGRSGMALGGFHYLNDNVLLNVGASYAGSNSTTFKAGVTFGW